MLMGVYIMKFRVGNCHLVISLNPALDKYADKYELFTKDGDEFVYQPKSVDSSNSICVDLPANLGVKLILNQVELSVINANGSIQLDLNDSRALVVNFVGNLSIFAKSSVIRCIGGSGYLQIRLINCQMKGVLGYKELSLNADSCDLDFSSRKGTEGLWSLSGENNRIHFDPLMKPNLMVNSNQDDWEYAGRNPQIFINIFGVQEVLGFMIPDSSDYDKEPSTFEGDVDDMNKVESNEALMSMFDHYEEQINSQINSLNKSNLNQSEEDAGAKLCDSKKSDELKSNVNNHQSEIMKLHLQGEITLDEMELLLGESQRVDES